MNLDDRTAHIRELIAQHQRVYEAAVTPLYAELARYESLRTDVRLIVPADSLGVLVIFPADDDDASMVAYSASSPLETPL